MDIDRILKLARLEIDNNEKEKLKKDFSSILGFVEKLEKLDVSNVKPMSYPIDIYNEMREDEIKQTTDDKRKTAKKLIDAAPNKKDDYIKVKEIL